MNNLIDEARNLSVDEVTPTNSFSPVILDAPNRGLPLEMRVTAPATGRDRTIILPPVHGMSGPHATKIKNHW